LSVIEVKNVSFSYKPGVPVLKGINLEFDERPTAIIGQNGAGKTTLVKLLKGLLKPIEGDVVVEGRNTKEYTVAQLSRYIGLVFQNPNDQIFRNKVIDEVMFGPMNIGMDADKAKSSAMNALEMVELSDRVEDHPYDLSLSDRKLLCIASVVAMNTDIVILDEPTIAQDSVGKQKIKRVVQYLKDENKLVISILHDMDFVAQTFERTIVLNKGELLLEGDTRFVFSHESELGEAHLEAPGISRLAKRLGISQTVLTAEEFVQCYPSV
jgi:energy-coupling factor transport system ATP-binding protein